MVIRVAVIGCGAAGLCAIRHLVRRSSVFSVTAFELSDEIGGTWVYTDQTGTDMHGLPIHSSMYKNLRTNLPKEVMAFPDFSFDTSLPSFIGHHDVLSYLKSYAAYYNLLEHIHFQTQVLKVEPVQCTKENSKTGFEQMWLVTSVLVTNKEQPMTQEFDAIIICNGECCSDIFKDKAVVMDIFGHYAVPLVPEIPGLSSFSGEVMHSHNYRTAQPFKDKSVLCLGAASSGQDISLDLASSAKLIYLCHNKPLIKSMLPSNVYQKSGIKSIEGSTVTLLNEEKICVDCILFCTGYHFSFPFLTDRCHVCIRDERITPLYKHIIHTEFPTLSFIGICKTICPFPQFHVQVQLVLAVLEGIIQLPTKTEMDADTQKDFEKRLSSGLPPRHAHTMGYLQWDYNDEIAELAKCPCIPRGVRRLYDAVHLERATNLIGYKNKNYKMVDDVN